MRNWKAVAAGVSKGWVRRSWDLSVALVELFIIKSRGYQVVYLTKGYCYVVFISKYYFRIEDISAMRPFFQVGCGVVAEALESAIRYFQNSMVHLLSAGPSGLGESELTGSCGNSEKTGS